MVLDIFAFIVIIVLIAVVIWLVTLLGAMPGNIARQRQHPQADAIGVLGWIGLLTMGVGWLVALVWAYTTPFERMTINQYEQRLAALEEKIQQLTMEGNG